MSDSVTYTTTGWSWVTYEGAVFHNDVVHIAPFSMTDVVALTDTNQNYFQRLDTVTLTINGVPVATTGPLEYKGYVVINGVQCPFISSNVDPAITLPVLGSYIVGVGFYGFILGLYSIPGNNYPPPLTVFNASMACFARGTRVATEGGYCRIEDLDVGDCVITQSGVARPVRWIGSRHVARPTAEQMPVCIVPDAFGPRQPERALYLSPEHAIFCDGLLVPCHALIDGDRIRQAACDEITYFHILLDTHDVILAEGLACETFLDVDGQGPFDNEGMMPDTLAFLGPYAPRVSQGPAVEQIRRRLQRQTVEA